MARRPRRPPRPRQPICGPPAGTAREAFIRFGNALHWEAYFVDIGLQSVMAGDDVALLEAALAQMPRAEHRRVAAYIAELTDGTMTFAEANAVWRAAQSNTTYWSSWKDPAAFLRFLRIVRDRIDPHARPASKSRFRPDPG